MATFYNSLTSATDDPLLPFLWSVKNALEGSGGSSQNLLNLLGDCIISFKDSEQYRNDVRFLKIWILYVIYSFYLISTQHASIGLILQMGVSSDFGSVFMEMLNCNVCTKNASLYVWSACFFELKGRLHDALTIYHLGISRNAEPIEWLKKAHALCHQRISEIWKASERQKIDYKGSTELGNIGINPWDSSILEDLMKKINPTIKKFYVRYLYALLYTCLIYCN
ncbi:hypothetical protein Ahy_B03g062633 isoform C [Arachis hypogaea]|uniref:BUB1 N-terminal domain-containing protein n=1 Tax=Arachis hypogaea TaxID=3818 RepID=A0A444ZUX5_ARAHY|nr:hypothetical protein Ahy_B03g062633 isoform C [Arachis hypogaea]